MLRYLEESSLKWATVIHQLSFSPQRPHGSAHSLEIPQDSALFYICALFFFYLCTFLFLFLYHAFIVASPSSFVLSLVSPSASVCGDDFLLDTNSNFFHCQPLTTETLHIALLSLLLYCFSTAKAAVTPFHILTPCFLVLCSFSCLRVDPMPHDTPKPPGYTRFVCISDTHSRTDAIQMPYGDVFIHAGDFTELGLPSEVKKFNDWLG